MPWIEHQERDGAPSRFRLRSCTLYMPLRLVTQSNAWKSNPPQPGNKKKTFSEVRLRYQSYLSEETGRTASSASTCTQPNHGCFLLCFDTVQSTGMYAFHESHRYSGNVFLWETETSSLVKSWEICELPVRSCKFIARRSQFICASGTSTTCIGITLHY